MQQAQAFLAAAFAGSVSAAFYGALRLIRRWTHAGRVLTAVLDLLFWLVAAALTAAAGALSGVDGLRFYVLFGAACGFILWEMGARRAVCAAMAALCRLFARK